MNDHVIPMFRITRKEILDKIAAKLESCARCRATIEKVMGEARLEAEKKQLAKAVETVNEIEENMVTMRDHLDDPAFQESDPEAGYWRVSAAQLFEIRTQLKTVDMTESEIRLGLDAALAIQNQQYNTVGRRPRH
ncbi:MAG TPA: hypothetical protein VFB66_01800 [Tepidisphaeraceae bacterium]|nr:hypothetical protein [Tepidisphaeraceae bacterium]